MMSAGSYSPGWVPSLETVSGRLRSNPGSVSLRYGAIVLHVKCQHLDSRD